MKKVVKKVAKKTAPKKTKAKVVKASTKAKPKAKKKTVLHQASSVADGDNMELGFDDGLAPEFDHTDEEELTEADLLDEGEDSTPEPEDE